MTAVRREAERYHDQFVDRVFHSVYIGGGTPTVLSEAQIIAILEGIKDHFRISRDAEWTVEANPNTVSKRNLAKLRSQGVNRLSLGVQSFAKNVLLRLGRLHTASEAGTAYQKAREAGFQNIGMDLMYGIPGQSMTEWSESLDTALAFNPEHLSLYSLSLDDGSVFKREAEAGRYALPDDDLAADMYEYAITALVDAGYCRYEVSNFAKPGRECLHNMNYWQRGEYLGIGPAAWSFLAGRRYHNIADASEYARCLARNGKTDVDMEMLMPEQSQKETIILSLRTANGLDLHLFEREYGSHCLHRLQGNIAPLVTAGLLTRQEGKAILTDRGFLMLNEVLLRLTG